MTLVKWKRPFDGLAKNPETTDSPLSGLLENFFGDNLFSNDSFFYPSVNIMEEDNKFIVELAAPGFEKKDFNIQVQNKVLNVSAKRSVSEEKKDRTVYRKEFNYGSFQRNFSLMEDVNESAIEAQYVNGVLRISLPKKEEAKKPSREIKIS
jgi:HSP20 family protein